MPWPLKPSDRSINKRRKRMRATSIFPRPSEQSPSSSRVFCLRPPRPPFTGSPPEKLCAARERREWAAQGRTSVEYEIESTAIGFAVPLRTARMLRYWETNMTEAGTYTDTNPNNNNALSLFPVRRASKMKQTVRATNPCLATARGIQTRPFLLIGSLVAVPCPPSPHLIFFPFSFSPRCDPIPGSPFAICDRLYCPLGFR